MLRGLEGKGNHRTNTGEYDKKPPRFFTRSRSSVLSHASQPDARLVQPGVICDRVRKFLGHVVMNELLVLNLEPKPELKLDSSVSGTSGTGNRRFV